MSKTTKTEQENKPPAWATPLFTQSATDAGNLYRSGSGGNTFTGSTVSDLSPTTMQGVNQLAQAGRAWNTAGTRPLYQGIGEAAVSNPFMGQLSGLSDEAGQPTSAATNLQGYASGDYLQGEGNPFYRQRLEREIGDSNALLNSQFSGKGRYGSPGAHQGVIAENTSNMLLQGLEEDFNRQTQNQFNAVGMIDQANQNALGLRGNMLSSAGGMYGTGIGQAQTAADSMAGLDQQNFQNRLTGAGATLQAGGILDEQAQKQLSDEVAKWYSLDNEDWTRLGMLQSAAAGAAGPYGSQVATSRQPVGIGGILSGIGSLLPSGKSDARLKENIVPLGWNGGFPVYEFSYIGRPERYIGVMAQDVLMRMPEAVVMEDDGFMAVDYRKIGFPMTRVH
jgi:hypothetical protein